MLRATVVWVIGAAAAVVSAMLLLLYAAGGEVAERTAWVAAAALVTGVACFVAGVRMYRRSRS